MQRTHFATVLGAVVVGTLLVAACAEDSKRSGSPAASTETDPTDSSAVDPTVDSTGDQGGSPIDWQPVDGDERIQEGWLEVPIDHADPAKGSFSLYLARHLADPDMRIGSLLVNPGGPGFGGSVLALSAGAIYSGDLLQHFDIVAWDPRGTGLSEPAIDCIDDADYDRFYADSDLTPEDDDERQHIVDLAEEFANSCAELNADIIQYIGTNSSARDMDLIRQALGEEKISYFGFSYGSELGAVWATLFPDTVRAAVLDGAVDPNADFVESGIQQSKGFEDTFQLFLADCAANRDCAFFNDGDPAGAFDQLMDDLDRSPIPTEPGRADANLQMLTSAVAQAMYSDSLWPTLAQALSDAQQGDGTGLLQLYDSYFERGPDGSYPNSLEAFQTIFCMDDPGRLSVAEEDATVPRVLAVAPHVSPGTTGSYFCTFFPRTLDPRVTITGKGAGPIVVVGSTGDAATPLEGTRAMARALEDGVLVIVDANQHTGYTTSDCAMSVVDDYLIDPVANAPADGTTCD